MEKNLPELSAYKCTIKLRTPVDTPFESDILWGCMIWALKYFYGEKKVEETIAEYSKNPPLILSDGFPHDHLPKPLYDIKSEKLEKLYTTCNNINPDRIIKIFKNIINRTLLPYNLVKTILKEPDKLLSTIKNCLECYICPLSLLPVKKIKKYELIDVIKKTCTVKNCFLLTGNSQRECKKITTSLPSLYDFKRQKGELWDIYLLSLWEKELILEILTFIGHNGYGKNTTYGKGAFSIEYLNMLDFKERIDTYSGEENGFMTLSSSYIPVPGEIEDVIDSRYKLLIKIGKLGGHWTSTENFFKYPLAMCRAGSIFPASPGTKSFWGQILKGVHPEHEKIVQYGLAFPMWGNFFEKR